MIDLWELALRLDELQRQADDPETWGEMDEDDNDELEELRALNETLEGLLDYPNGCSDMELVERGEEAAWAREQAATYEWMDDSNPLFYWVDWNGYGEGELQHWPEFTFQGDTYYYNDMR